MTSDDLKIIAAKMIEDRDRQLRILVRDILHCFGPNGNTEAEWPAIRNQLSDLSDLLTVQYVRAALLVLSKQGEKHQSVQPIHDYLTSRGLRLFPSWDYRSPNLQQVPRK